MRKPTKYDSILRYYRNKARATAEHALTMLAESEALGYWPKGYSRKVRAALNKTHRDETAEAAREAYSVPGRLSIDIQYGILDRLVKLPALDAPPALKDWLDAFMPVATALALLDATRPKPEYVFKTVSPLLFQNVGKELGLKFSSVRAPDRIWTKVEGKDKKGNVIYFWEPKLIWPEGTRHNVSKFCWGSKAGNNQCQACGHAIKNNYNWVPLALDEPGESPVALWVGRDCAETLFGCKVTGEAEFRGPVRAQTI